MRGAPPRTTTRNAATLRGGRGDQARHAVPGSLCCLGRMGPQVNLPVPWVMGLTG